MGFFQALRRKQEAAMPQVSTWLVQDKSHGV